MSKLKTNTIRHTGGSADNITLDNSQNVTVEGNATVDGTSTLTGNVTTSGDVNFTPTTAGRSMMWDKSRDALGFKDNCIAEFGTGNDLQVYHDSGSTESRVWHTKGSGWLNLRGDAIKLGSHTDLEDYIVCSHGGFVKLFHDNSARLETLASGVAISDEGDSTVEMKFSSSGGTIGYVYGNTDQNHFGLLTEDGEWIVQGNQNASTNLYYNGSKKLQTGDSAVWITGGVVPENNDSYDIGKTTSKWDDVYATNGTIQTSDRNEKNTIVDSDLGLSFVNKLKPVSYKFNGKTRTHYGLISQDVETTLDGKDFAGFIKEDLPDELYTEGDDLPEGKKVGDVKKAAYTSYGLRYSEFISPLIKAVQELSAEVETLKTKVASLEAAD